MKRHSLSISIPEPCHENWAKMTIQQMGRHCASCNKTVTDFTKMSKSGIVNYMSSHKGGMCGRFRFDQLNVNLLPAKRNRLFSKWAALFFGLIPFVGFGQAPIHTNEPIEHTIMGKRMMKSVKTTISEPISKKEYLKGKLIDAETKEPILFGSVALKKEGVLVKGTQTDSDGNFNIDINDVDEIVFSYIGYEKIRKSISEIKNLQESFLTIELKMQGYLLGDVEIVAYPVGIVKGGFTTTGYMKVGESDLSEKESWIKRQWKKLKRLATNSYIKTIENRAITKTNRVNITAESQDFDSQEITFRGKEKIPFEVKKMNIYPNPSAGLITIEMPDGFTHGILQVANTENQIIYSANINSDEVQYDASTLLSGSYIISISSENALLLSEVFIKI